jgi:predicted DNA-binding protein
VKRTQIYLPEELHEVLRRIAFEQRRSMADVIREAVSAYVAEQWDGSVEQVTDGNQSNRKSG